MYSNLAFKKEWLNRLLIVGIAILFVCTRFYQELDTTKGMVISQHGDGYKAYTVIQYHAINDSTYSHFEGMNYPYGEHVIPGACQPFISNTVKFINNNFFEIPTWTIIPIVNYSIVLSFILCIFFLFLIFRKLELPVWYSGVLALGLTFLTPQTMRIAAHYGLSHPEVVPVVLYLLMGYSEKPSWKYSLWMTFVVMIYSSIHFYYFAIMAFTVAFYFLFKFLDEWDWKKVPTYALHFGIMLLIPFVIFSWWMHDPSITDRSDQPWGFFHYRAFLEGIFTSPRLSLYQWIDKNIVDIRSLNIENRSYVGLVAAIFFLVSLVAWIKSGFRKAFLSIEHPSRKFMNYLAYAAIAIMIFSLGIPFIIPGLENYLEYTGPVQQFRSIGRFAWVFYYVMNILAFTYLYDWVTKKNTTSAKVVFGLALTVLFFEAIQFTTSKSFKPKKIPALEDANSIASNTNIDFDKYQAILPVPYYNLGSDMFWYDIHGFGGQHSLTLSLQQNLPTIGATLTRTSRNQAFNQMQLVSTPYRTPKVLADYPNTKPLLLMWDIEMSDDELEAKYGHLLEGATLLGEYNNQVRFYSVPLTSFNYSIAKRKRAIKEKLATKDSLLIQFNELYSTDSTENFVYLPFNEEKGEKIYFSEGAYQGVMRDQNMLFQGKLPNQKTEKYNISFWMYMDVDRYNRADVTINEIDPKSGDVLQFWKGGVHRRIWTIDNNAWGMVEIDFTPKSAESYLQIIFQEKELGKRPVWIDELLIRPASTDLYLESEDFIWKNNRHFLK